MEGGKRIRMANGKGGKGKEGTNPPSRNPASAAASDPLYRES